MLDYIRVACAVPQVSVGDVKKNARDICDRIAKADEKAVDLLVFPELSLTGYTCADLFFQKTLLEAVTAGMKQILACSGEYPRVTAVVGLPYMIDGQLYNCGAVISGGVLQGLVAKTFLPNYNEFNEKRWFASAQDLCQEPIEASKLGLDEDYTVSLSTETFFAVGDGAKIGVEICEDLFAPIAPSAGLAMGGAEVIVNLAASNETVGKRTFRRDMVKHQSLSCICGYAFCSAGETESTQDTVFSGHSIIVQNGTVLAENTKSIDTDYMLIADIDLGKIRAERSRKTSFRDAATAYYKQYEITPWDCLCDSLRGDGTLHPVQKMPFVPEEEQARLERCRSVFQMQVSGLKRRLQTIGAKPVIGISGGLDSTLALLVAVEAMRQLNRPLHEVHGITMPCFGTSERTYNNACELMKLLGVSSREISIRDAVLTHFKDIGHDPQVHDTTYENVQARERTQVLMDYAGRIGGIVVGTGDLSELALGWCTYNGDHMSMYSVNGSVPKTLIGRIIEAVSGEAAFAPARSVLADIVATPISPELLPPDEKGKISQATEDIVGPYALHDFFLFYVLRFGFTPTKIYHLACRAFADTYDSAAVKKWLVNFYRRFFSQQFKRNCQPDGVKIGSVCVGPRGDLQIPSDAAASLWLEEAETL